MQCLLCAWHPCYRTKVPKDGADRSLAPQVNVIVRDALRKQRNLSDCSGDTIPDAAA